MHQARKLERDSSSHLVSLKVAVRIFRPACATSISERTSKRNSGGVGGLLHRRIMPSGFCARVFFFDCLQRYIPLLLLAWCWTGRRASELRSNELMDLLKYAVVGMAHDAPYACCDDGHHACELNERWWLVQDHALPKDRKADLALFVSAVVRYIRCNSTSHGDCSHPKIPQNSDLHPCLLL